jgi:hypothetical protein
MASDCRASNGRISFAGCDDLVLNAGTADIVLGCDSAVTTLLSPGPDGLRVLNAISKRKSSDRHLQDPMLYLASSLWFRVELQCFGNFRKQKLGKSSPLPDGWFADCTADNTRSTT